MADGSIRIAVGIDTSKASKQLDSLKQKIARTEADLESREAGKSALEEKLGRAKQEAENTKGHIADLKQSILDMEAALRGDAGATEYGFEEFTQLPDDIARAKEELTAAENLLKEQEKTVISIGNEHDKIEEKLEKERQKLDEMKDSAGGLEREIAQTETTALPSVGTAIDRAKAKLLRFVKAAVGIASLTALFRVLKNAIVGAVTEFAKHDPETQKRINELKTALTGLKMSWGAAFAPILNAVAPLLQKLIGWLSSAANAVSQFMAVLSGQSTYKRAITNQSNLAKGIGDVGVAAAEANKQLMAFDELNILQNNTSSGGGSGSESVPIDVEEEKISPWANWLADHLQLIKELAIAVGAALLTWNVAEFISQLFGLNLTMSQLLGLAVAVGGAVLYAEGFVDALNNGVNWDNTIAMISGCALAALGLGLAFGTTWAAVALLAGAGGMLVVGIKDWIEKGELSTETFWLLEAAILAVGVAMALLLSPWSLLVAAFAGGALAIYKNWDLIKQWFDEKVKPWFTVEKWKELGQNAMTAIRDGLNSISLPKFHFSWETTGYTASFFGKEFTVNIPFPHLDWYAKGGVVDGLTPLIAGEAGKEAIVPLERNTEWITLVANGLMERFTQKNFANQLAEAFTSTPLPAMAGGYVVPPNAAYGGAGTEWNRSISDKLDALTSQISALASQPIQVNSKMYLDRREIGRSVSEYQRDEQRARGR